MLNIKELTEELMKGHMEIIEDIEEVIMELNLKELVLDNGFTVHRLEVEKNDNYFIVRDAEGTFELDLDLFCEINYKMQMDIANAFECIEQCEELSKNYTTYKRALSTFKTEIKDCENEELTVYLEEFVNKYEIRIGMISDEMHELGLKLSDLCKELEKEIDFDKFIDIFNLHECADSDDNEVVRDESYYNNLMFNRGAVGRVVRTGIIHSEQLVRNMIDFKI